MKWITREKIKVDRVACPWLIKHFVDPEAEFVFLSHATDWSKIDNGIVFDVPNCELGHHGEDVSFDSLCRRPRTFGNSRHLSARFRRDQIARWRISDLSRV
jgi:hypothetical protein